LDSNFLLVPFQFGLDIIAELRKVLRRSFEPVVLSTTYEELLKLSHREPAKLKKQATLALKLCEELRRIQVEPCDQESHDDAIVRMAAKLNGCVATNDRMLKKRLRASGIPVVFLRQKSHLEKDGPI
jgi:rRNA-processing protein FCF1